MSLPHPPLLPFPPIECAYPWGDRFRRGGRAVCASAYLTTALTASISIPSTASAIHADNALHSRMRVPPDGQGQAPTAMPPLEAGQTSDNINATSIDAATAPIPSLEPAAVSTVSPTPAAPLTDLASTTSDRPDGPNGPESAAEPETVKEPFLEKQEVAEPVQAPLTNGSSLPPTAPAAETHTTTLNANAVNEAGEAEHAARVEQEAKVETAILEADKVKQEQDDDLARQRTPLTDLSLLQTNAATDAGGRDTPQSPPSPSSTSALSSVTASAAPSVAKVTPSSQSVKDPKEDEEGSESGQPADADKKPRSTGGRSTARRAASNASLRDTAASSTTSTRRSEKPASSSSATGANGTRTRGTSAQGGQPQRQSSRSKTTTATSERTSNTRPRMRQRGSPDPKDGNDTTPGTRRSRRTRQSTAQNGRANGEDDDSDDGDEGVTRCICGNNGELSCWSAMLISSLLIEVHLPATRACHHRR